MSRSFITECLVLKSKDYKEADKILTLFTKSDGKVNAIAKGVRKQTSRKAGSLDAFTYSKVSLVLWKDIYIITQAEVIDSYDSLKRKLGKQSKLYLVGETLDNLLPFNEEQSDLFQKVVVNLEKTTSEDLLIIILYDLGYWSEKFPRDLDSIKRYIESLMDNKLNSYKLMERIEHLGV
ncbi:MAG: DNA repair protein RecO [bacterium]